MKSFIFVTTQFEGYHNYPEALEGVSFLRNRHRHIFHVKVWIEVFENNREIEFFLFKRFINNLIDARELDNMSCEMISDQFADEIKLTYPDRDIRIEISEDQENGSYKEYSK